MHASGGRVAAGRGHVEALAALVRALRSVQISRGDHPWLVLDLTMAQLKALLLLVETGGVRTRELADRLGIAPSAATPLVDRLVGQRLARRQDDPGDRRIVWIRPTARAAALHNRLMQANRSVVATVLAGVPPAEREQVHQSVLCLLRSAEAILGRTPHASHGTPVPAPRTRSRASR